MSNPVIRTTWAGDFDCSICRRKRLTASEFSKKNLDDHRKHGKALKCTARATASIADARNMEKSEEDGDSTIASSTSASTIMCTNCQQVLPAIEFSKTQRRNAMSSGSSGGKVKCLKCVVELEKTALMDVANAKQEKLKEAKAALDEAMRGSDKVAQLKATTHYAALEAEIVTGIKPKILGDSGRGRGRGGGRGGGRGRSR